MGDEALKENGNPYTGEYWIEKTKLTATNGIIRLKKGETAKIVGIPSGTSFKVKEVSLDDTVYENPKYSVEGAEDPATDGQATGKFVLESETLVTVTNTLKSVPDTPYIKVQKTFDGVSKEDLTANFKINLYSDVDCENLVGELTLNDAANMSVSEDGLTYTWRIDNLPAGTYWINESGTDVQGYNLTGVVINGNSVSLAEAIEVTTRDAVYELDPNNSGATLPPNTHDYIIPDTTNIVAGSLTGNGDDGATFFIWTEDTLSSGERNAIVKIIKTMGSNFNKIAVDNTKFFSTEERIEDGIDYRGTISIETTSAGKRQLTFSADSQWNKIAYATYIRKDTVNAEIEIVNSYDPKTMDVDLQKYGSSYDVSNQQSGAKFDLYKGSINNTSQEIEWESNPTQKDIEVKNSTEEIELMGLASGYYKLQEVKAPAGFQLLDEEIFFKVDADQKTITLIDGQTGADLISGQQMWRIEKGNQIQIQNKALYSLPSAGGPGIFLYMIGGTLLLIAGSLMIYINRRKGVLRK